VVCELQPDLGMDVELQTRDFAMQPEWRALIEQRLARLADPSTGMDLAALPVRRLATITDAYETALATLGDASSQP